MNGSNIVIRQNHAFLFDVKYKAPGFDIFQKSNENGSLTLFFMIFFACVLLKRIFPKKMKLFGQAIFRGLARFVKSSVRVDIGFNGSPCIFFHFCTFDILLNCFTVHTNLLRLRSSIHCNILQIFVADIWVFFRRQIDQEKFALNGSILFKQLYVASQRLYVPVLCQFRKEGCYFTYFNIFSAFHQLWCLFNFEEYCSG